MDHLWVKYKNYYPVLVSTIGCVYLAQFVEAVKIKMTPALDSISLGRICLALPDSDNSLEVDLTLEDLFIALEKTQHNAKCPLIINILEENDCSDNIHLNKEEITLLLKTVKNLETSFYDYSEGNATVRRDPEFRQNLILFYGLKTKFRYGKKKLQCMLTGNWYPAENVIAGHIFKHKFHATFYDLMKRKNIDEAENGLLLYKPIEWAFDDARLCFLPGNQENSFVCHLLDTSIIDFKLSEKAANLLGSSYINIGFTLFKSGMTFGDLHGKELIFYNQNRPLKRYLCFQAQMAFRKAERLGWNVPHGSVYTPFWIDDDLYGARILSFLNNSYED